MSGPRPAGLVAALLTFGLLAIGLAALVASVVDRPFEVLVRDVTAMVDERPYVGALSLLNVVVWSVISALSAFVAWITRPTVRAPAALLGAFTAAMAIDDALLLHEDLGPMVGVPERLFILVYAIAAAGVAGLLVLRRIHAAILPYVVGGAALAASLVVDQVTEDWYGIEDSLKLLGALVWIAVPILVHASAPAGVDAETDIEPNGAAQVGIGGPTQSGPDAVADAKGVGVGRAG